MYSKYSNGEQREPMELLKTCRAAGLDMMVIAGHNSVRGSRIALRHQQKYGITCIPTIEIDTVPQDAGYHILRYGTDVHNPVFDGIEERVVSQERKASKRHRQLVRDMRVAFDEKRIQKLSLDGITTGKVIGETAMEYGVEKKNPLLQPCYPGGERSDSPFVNFYWDICAPGKSTYVEIFYPSANAIVELLHQQNVLAIVAHPGMNTKERTGRIHDLLQLGVDGPEMFSPCHSEQQTQSYYDLAKSHGLYTTCGSSFHGKTKPIVHTGTCSIEEEEDTCPMHKPEALRI